jgi:hypothetical protein
MCLGGAACRLIKLRQWQRRLQREAPRLLLLRNSDGGEECLLWHAAAACAMSDGKPARGIVCTVANALLITSDKRSALAPSTPAALAKMPVTIAPGERYRYGRKGRH